MTETIALMGLWAAMIVAWIVIIILRSGRDVDSEFTEPSKNRNARLMSEEYRRG